MENGRLGSKWLEKSVDEHKGLNNCKYSEEKY